MGEPVKSVDEEFERANRAARQEGLGCLGFMLIGALLGLALRWWTP